MGHVREAAGIMAETVTHGDPAIYETEVEFMGEVLDRDKIARETETHR